MTHPTHDIQPIPQRRPARRFGAVLALAVAVIATVATASEASARSRHGGGHGGGHHLGLHRPHHQQLPHNRPHLLRQIFTRHQPCMVWTRQGWTNVCGTRR